MRSKSVFACDAVYTHLLKRIRQNRIRGSEYFGRRMASAVIIVFVFILLPHNLRAQQPQCAPIFDPGFGLEPSSVSLESQSGIVDTTPAPPSLNPSLHTEPPIHETPTAVQAVMEETNMPATAVVTPPIGFGTPPDSTSEILDVAAGWQTLSLAGFAGFLTGLFLGIAIAIVIIDKRGKKTMTGNNKDTSQTGEDSHIDPVPEAEVTLLGTRCVCLDPWVHDRKQDDRIFTGLIANRYPAIIVADGASNYNDSEKGEVPGGGGDAAATVLTYLRDGLDRLLTNTPPAKPSLEMVLDQVNDLMLQAETRLLDHNAHADVPGATTLLFAFLYATSNELYWIYGYIGDGDIVLISPSRSISDWPCETWLMTPHKLGDSPVLFPRGDTRKGFSPVTGVIPYRPDDILYVTSDGLEYVSRFLRRHRKLTFGQYLWDEVFRLPSTDRAEICLPDPVAQYQEQGIIAYDDISLGVIWTKQQVHMPEDTTREKEESAALTQ